MTPRASALQPRGSGEASAARASPSDTIESPKMRTAQAKAEAGASPPRVYAARARRRKHRAIPVHSLLGLDAGPRGASRVG